MAPPGRAVRAGEQRCHLARLASLPLQARFWGSCAPGASAMGQVLSSRRLWVQLRGLSLPVVSLCVCPGWTVDSAPSRVGAWPGGVEAGEGGVGPA